MNAAKNALKYKIPDNIADAVIARDKSCIYCRAAWGTNVVASWEHIDNDGPTTEENMALCCKRCNSSKGTKSLGAWLSGQFCADQRIQLGTLAPVAKEFLLRAIPE
jgi:hypothetical protein